LRKKGGAIREGTIVALVLIDEKKIRDWNRGHVSKEYAVYEGERGESNNQRVYENARGIVELVLSRKEGEWGSLRVGKQGLSARSRDKGKRVKNSQRRRVSTLM